MGHVGRACVASACCSGMVAALWRPRVKRACCGFASAGTVVQVLVLLCPVAYQVVFEVFDENVRRGGEVYEDGHVLVLAWCAGQRDFEVLTKVLFQVRAVCRVLERAP